MRTKNIESIGTFYCRDKKKQISEWRSYQQALTIIDFQAHLSQ